MYKIFLIILVIYHLNKESEAFNFNLNKIICNATDPSFMIFEKCLVKAVSRDRQYGQIYAKLLKSLNNINLRLQFKKRESGWKPFMYDITVKCDFLKKLNPLTKLIWSWVKDVTNINKSCPFDHDIEVYFDNNYVASKALADLPVPNGIYALFATLTIENKIRAWTNFYGTIY